MTITVNIYYRGEGTAAKDFALEMISSGIVSEIREKEGNLKYEYFMPLEENGTVLLIDQWTNQNALDEHHLSQTMEKIMKLREKYTLTMEVERYTEDQDGIPKHDEQYIVRNEDNK
ncbi:putative quinol monooxygenase [Mammaliicoccus sp. Dog046]|uniref:antibiotic biosynthesis monooxygenase family protein n=1 Tax=Mammaliicoccus sp. Dog046 TaxID=3034233 RepID=UPI002B26139E|nr:putative quinol monooxygenase [Mammaliicoccus sp. Dog046]WQK85110.1 putative quinol monooxygenase [Mammaliicoccus sp. Dog046]